MAHDDNGGGKKPRPLEGVRIVESSVWHAGPGASAILGDLGAEVIKIETLTGDPERFHAGFGPLGSFKNGRTDWNLMFEFSNRNKSGISIDTNTDEGKEVLHRLVQSADIFLTNLRMTTAAKNGLDYKTLSRINPKIIHVNVNGFGPNGPMKDIGGFDAMGQAVSGMTFLAGTDEPTLLQALVLDQMTAITASHAMLTALIARDRHGIGQEVFVSLYGSALWLTHANLLATSVLKENIKFKFDRMKNPALRTNFKCGDGKWIVSTNHPDYKYWPIFCEAVDRTDLLKNPKFITPEDRTANLAELITLIDGIMLTKTRKEWLDIFSKHQLNFVAVNEMIDVIEDPQALENDYLVDFKHPVLGTIQIPGYPVSFSGSTVGTHGRAPDLGEHNDQVLAGLGYSKDAIERLRRNKSIK